MPTAEKIKKVSQIKELLKEAKIAIFSNFQGLEVKEMNRLRQNLKKEGIVFYVVKNSLAQIAVEEIGMEELEEFLSGPTVLTIGAKEIVKPAKMLDNYSRENKSLKIKGGLLQGKKITEEEVLSLAQLPSREILLMQLLGIMQSPIRNFLNVLSAPLNNLVHTLSAIKDKKEGKG